MCSSSNIKDIDLLEREEFRNSASAWLISKLDFLLEIFSVKVVFWKRLTVYSSCTTTRCSLRATQTYVNTILIFICRMNDDTLECFTK